jgi:hypothetical protein
MWIGMNTCACLKEEMGVNDKTFWAKPIRHAALPLLPFNKATAFLLEKKQSHRITLLCHCIALLCARTGRRHPWRACIGAGATTRCLPRRTHPLPCHRPPLSYTATVSLAHATLLPEPLPACFARMVKHCAGVASARIEG